MSDVTLFGFLFLMIACVICLPNPPPPEKCSEHHKEHECKRHCECSWCVDISTCVEWDSNHCDNKTKETSNCKAEGYIIGVPVMIGFGFIGLICIFVILAFGSFVLYITCRTCARGLVFVVTKRFPCCVVAYASAPVRIIDRINRWSNLGEGEHLFQFKDDTEKQMTTLDQATK